MKSSEDKARRIAAALSYIFFPAGLIVKNKNAFSVFHSSQGLTMILVVSLLFAVSLNIQFIGKYFMLPLTCILYVGWAAVGIANSISGKMAVLPFIGGLSLIKYKQTDD